MNIDIKKISELNEAIYNDNLLFLVEDQDGKGKKLKGANFIEELKSDLVAKANVLSYEEIIASTPPIDLDIGIPKASALKHLKPITGSLILRNVTHNTTLAYIEGANITIPANCIFGITACLEWGSMMPTLIMLTNNIQSGHPANLASTSNTGNDGAIYCSYIGFTTTAQTFYVYGKNNEGNGYGDVIIKYWYIQL